MKLIIFWIRCVMFVYALNKQNLVSQLISIKFEGFWNDTYLSMNLYWTESFTSVRYFLTLIVDYSVGVWIYFLVDKKKTPIHLQNFLSMVQTQFHTTICTIHSNNGSEFLCLKDHFLKLGIVHKALCVGTP